MKKKASKKEMLEISKIINLLRKKYSITIKHKAPLSLLATKIGVSIATVANWGKMKSYPSKKHVKRLLNLGNKPKYEGDKK